MHNIWQALGNSFLWALTDEPPNAASVGILSCEGLNWKFRYIMYLIARVTNSDVKIEGSEQAEFSRATLLITLYWYMTIHLLTAHVTSLTGMMAGKIYSMVISWWCYVSLFNIITCGHVAVHNIRIWSEEIPHPLTNTIMQCKNSGVACCKCMSDHSLKKVSVCHRTCLHAARHAWS